MPWSEPHAFFLLDKEREKRYAASHDKEYKIQKMEGKNNGPKDYLPLWSY